VCAQSCKCFFAARPGIARGQEIESERWLRGWKKVPQLVSAIAPGFEHLTEMARILGEGEFPGTWAVEIEQS
jgi:hypothetical protein